MSLHEHCDLGLRLLLDAFLARDSIFQACKCIRYFFLNPKCYLIVKGIIAVKGPTKIYTTVNEFKSMVIDINRWFYIFLTRSGLEHHHCFVTGTRETVHKLYVLDGVCNQVKIIRIKEYRAQDSEKCLSLL